MGHCKWSLFVVKLSYTLVEKYINALSYSTLHHILQCKENKTRKM